MQSIQEVPRKQAETDGSRYGKKMAGKHGAGLLQRYDRPTDLLIRILLICPALVTFPPVGRAKIPCGAGKKARGRNELIADAVGRWTKAPRDRKQVSSHIQVLKPMVRHDEISKAVRGEFLEDQY